MDRNEIAQTLTRVEIIEQLATLTGTKKSKLIVVKTDTLVDMLASATTVVVAEPEAIKLPKAKKTTRTCKICGFDKPLAEYGPTHKQVACKGECLKEYTRQAIGRAKARKAALATEAPALPYANTLVSVAATSGLVLPRHFGCGRLDLLDGSTTLIRL